MNGTAEVDEAEFPENIFICIKIGKLEITFSNVINGFKEEKYETNIV